MRFSEVLAASSVASLVAAHGGIQGAPKLFGLPNNIKIRTPSPRAARAAAAMEGPHYLQARQGGNADNRCGPDFGNAVCAAGYCCSGAGYCGTSKDHCNAPDCLFNFGPGCDANKTPAGASTRNDARPQKGNVAYGGEGIYACRTPGTVAITYDDGPYTYTDEVLNKFAAAGFKATFFVTGINIGKGAIDEQWSAPIKRMVAEGHQVASHTWSHQDLSAITDAQVYDQMVKNEMAIRNIIGKYPTYMRPPYSSCTGSCPGILQSLGYVISYFDLDTDDYNQLTPVKIETAKNNFRNAVNSANPASDSKLAIAHDIHELTALNLTVTMIETLQARGFRGVTMGECMGEAEANWYRDSTPATPGSSTTSTPTAPTSTPTGTVSTDGTCGTQGNNQICIGSEFGNCCSQYGYCGKSTDHCGTGCDTVFGNCGTNANPTSASSTSAPQPTGALTTSTDGTCGGSSGYTCIGFVHEGVKSECCSQYNYCGASTDHCGNGCNPLAGTCVSSSVSSSAALSSSAPVSSTDKPESISSSAVNTLSVTSTAASSPSTTPSVSTNTSGDESSTASSINSSGSSSASVSKLEESSSTVSSVHSDVTSSASDKPESSTATSVHPDATSSASDEHESTTTSSVHPDVTSSASDEHESTTVSSVYSTASSLSSVPTNPSQTSSVYADDHSTAISSSVASSTYPVASSTGDSKASSTVDYSATSSTEYPSTFASSVKPATTTPCTTSSTPVPTPTQPVSQDGKCGGIKGQTCAGYKNSFGFKLACCCKTTGRCSADPWACTAGCDKKNGKCWY